MGELLAYGKLLKRTIGDLEEEEENKGRETAKWKVDVEA